MKKCKEVMVEIEKSGEVIIYPVKTEMKISDIPVDAIKELIDYRYDGDSKKNWSCLAASEVEKWLNDNNL